MDEDKITSERMVTYPHRLHFNAVIEMSIRIRKDFLADRHHGGTLGTSSGCNVGNVGGLRMRRVTRARQDLRKVRSGFVRCPPAENLEARVEDGQDAVGI